MPPDGTLLPALADAAKQARERASASTAQVAIRAGVDPSTVRRFERGRAWPRDPDELIAAYATLTGTHPLRIWRTAIDGADRPPDL